MTKITSNSKKNKMMQILPLWALFLGIAIIFWLNYRDKEKDKEMYSFKAEGVLVIQDSTGKEKKKIDIEIADTEYDRQLGLMFRESLEENQGMLFIFPYQGELSFWMKNTKISLDILFINKERKIVTIHKRTTPYSEKSLPTLQPAQYVLEVIGGFTDKFSINEGDFVRW